MRINRRTFLTTSAVGAGGLAIACAQAKAKLSAVEEADYVRQLLAAPAQIETVLNLDKFFKRAASALKDFKGFLY